MNNTPPSSAEAVCPRCGGGFDCGAERGHCDCFELKLSVALRAKLASQWPGQCLCLRCLRALQTPSADAASAGRRDTTACP